MTDVGGNLTGYLQNISADRSQPDGLRRQSVNLAGSVSGSHLVFGRLTAESTWAGLTVAFLEPSGQIATINYKRSSIAEVNETIGRLTADAGQQKATAGRSRRARAFNQ